MLNTADEVIDELGGTAAVAKLTERTPQAASNWRKANRLPAHTFLTLKRELEQRGLSAAPSLWGITEPERS
jgi:hypothetical protein